MSKEKAEVKTAVKVSEYQGNQMFGVWKVDEEGNSTSNFPVVSFGITKAKKILEHLEELKEYVKEQEK